MNKIQDRNKKIQDSIYADFDTCIEDLREKIDNKCASVEEQQIFLSGGQTLDNLIRLREYPEMEKTLIKTKEAWDFMKWKLVNPTITVTLEVLKMIWTDNYEKSKVRNEHPFPTGILKENLISTFKDKTNADEWNIIKYALKYNLYTLCTVEEDKLMVRSRIPSQDVLFSRYDAINTEVLRLKSDFKPGSGNTACRNLLLNTAKKFKSLNKSFDEWVNDITYE